VEKEQVKSPVDTHLTSLFFSLLRSQGMFVVKPFSQNQQFSKADEILVDMCELEARSES